MAHVTVVPSKLLSFGKQLLFFVLYWCYQLSLLLHVIVYSGFCFLLFQSFVDAQKTTIQGVLKRGAT